MDSGLSDRGSSIRVFFEPKSVAVVGASRMPGKLGNTVLKNLITLKYEGQVFPVNPNAYEIGGLKAYPSVAKIPDEVDLAVIAIPAPMVLDVVRDCARKRVRGVVIISSGFGEAGAEGAKRQLELTRIAARAEMRIVGPNTTGMLNSHNRFTTTFVELNEVREGSVAFIAQTGMFAGMMLEHILTREKFGLSKVAGLGNKCDVADDEILDYLARDTATRVIMMYIEGIKDGKRFFETARRLTGEKPIIVLKVGRTEAGAEAALSHTGSLTGRDEVFQALCQQAGIIRASDFDELVDFAKMFAYQPPPSGNRVAIVTLSGGAGVMAADACLQSGLRLAYLDPRTLQKLAEKMPSWATVRNPVDIEPLSEMVGSVGAYQMALEATLSDKSVDLCLLIMGTIRMPKVGASFLKEIKNAYPQKPIAVCIIGVQEIYDQLFHIIEEAKIPVFPSVRRAANGLASLYRYRQLRG
jgi:acetyl coenzyme A synthetase (ADP forming)-like protein